MRVHVVSDVHGNVDALAKAGDGADALIVLGDLIDFADYANPAGGIVGRVLGSEVGERFRDLRANGRPGELGAFARQAWSRLDDPAAVVDAAVREQYAALFAAMPTPTYAIPGNVDVPDLWPEFVRPGVHAVDGQVVVIGGVRFGFVGGVPLPPGTPSVPERSGWRPFMRESGDYDAAVRALGPVDVLCSHAPPDVPELRYDVVTRRPELASAALTGFVHRHRPRTALFGHVHQPLAQRARVGPTECVNVGHFRRTGVPYVLRW